MMIVSVLVVCVGVPLVFIFMGAFPPWLQSIGVHASPNFAGGYPIASFGTFDRQTSRLPPQLSAAGVERALAIRRFSVTKVAYHSLSGVGIAPRLNLVFEFDGQLPDPQNSSSKFSLTVIHVYIKAPGKTPGTAASDKVAEVEFVDPGWDYEVIIDGFHDQLRIFDSGGNLVGRGVGLYVDYQYAGDNGNSVRPERRVIATTITAALPMKLLGDPASGQWLYYVLVGLGDSRHPSMMLHSAPDGGLDVFCRAVPEGLAQPLSTASGKPILMPLLVSNNH